MKRIVMIQTADGVVHTDQHTAQKHVEKQYGDIICKLAGDLANIDKYSKAIQYIEANLALFVRLHDLKLDMSFTNEDHHEED